MDITVKLEIYEGPLDLLLHLIKKNEVDIYDIPIALITSQYLEYLELMESLNIELAGDFLLMAATLTQIKSKMLLPVPSEEEETEEEDPRMAIVRPLLEHIRLREAAEVLERRTVLNRDVFAREISLADLDLEPEGDDLIEANLYDLIDAFRTLVSHISPNSDLRIKVETKTIQERITEIVRQLKVNGKAGFVDLCADDRTKVQLILSFLAILELARVGAIHLYQHQVSMTIMVFLVEESKVFKINNLDQYNGQSQKTDATDPDMEFDDA